MGGCEPGSAVPARVRNDDLASRAGRCGRHRIISVHAPEIRSSGKPGVSARGPEQGEGGAEIVIRDLMQPLPLPLPFLSISDFADVRQHLLAEQFERFHSWSGCSEPGVWNDNR